MLQRSHPVPGRHIWQKKHLLLITSPVKSSSCKKIQIQCPFIALILFLLYTLTLEQALNKEICAWHRNKWTKCVQPFQESCQGYQELGCEGIEEEGTGEEKKHKIVEVNYKMPILFSDPSWQEHARRGAQEQGSGWMTNCTHLGMSQNPVSYSEPRNSSVVICKGR